MNMGERGKKKKRESETPELFSCRLISECLKRIFSEKVWKGHFGRKGKWFTRVEGYIFRILSVITLRFAIMYFD